MTRFFGSAALATALLFSAVPAQASTLTQTQISAILGLLQSFGADQSVIANVAATLGGSSTGLPEPTWCHTFNTNLQIGNSSNEVAALQTALSKQGFGFSLEADKVGFRFGEGTASAVTAFQEKYKSIILTPNGLLHGTGYVGAATRAKLNSLYGCSGVKPPMPSTAPYISYLSPASGPVGATVTLRGTNFAAENSIFMDNMLIETQDNSAGAFPTSLTFRIPSFLGRNCETNPVIGCGTVTWVTLGAHNIQVRNTNGQSNIVTFMVTGSISQGTPVISGVSGPTSLQVGQQGTWTVNASDPNGGTLNYSVVWGDENQGGTGASSMTAAPVSQTATFTHTYASVSSCSTGGACSKLTSATYTPTFTVSNSSGQSAQTSVSVNVGQQTVPSVTVLSPNGGETIGWNTVMMAGDLYVKWTTSQKTNYHPSSLLKAYVVDSFGNVVRDDPITAAIYVTDLGGGVFSTSFAGERNLNINTKYKIKVCDYLDNKGSEQFCDSSDDYFTLSNVSFSTTPTFGTAPLAVYLRAVSDEKSRGVAYAIDYGDGTTGTMNTLCEFGGCSLTQETNHTYTKAGTYTAKLLSNSIVISRAVIVVAQP